MLDNVYRDVVLRALDLQRFGDEGQRSPAGNRLLQAHKRVIQPSVRGFELRHADPNSLKPVSVIVEMSGEGFYLELQVLPGSRRLAFLLSVDHVEVGHQKVRPHEPASTRWMIGSAALLSFGCPLSYCITSSRATVVPARCAPAMKGNGSVSSR